jgi:hypothetical protein
MMDTVHQYFIDHPEHREGVWKAIFAYHVPSEDVLQTGGAHKFHGGARWHRCMWCRRSREEVRHDDLPPECQSRPAEFRSIADVLRDEEARYCALLARAVDVVPRVIAKKGLSGETLAILHHTYGYDPEVVAGVVDVPPVLMKAYYAKMEEERERSRAAFKPEVITAQAS